MKSAKEWVAEKDPNARMTEYDSVDFELPRMHRSELRRLIAAVQADAAADMRERAAKECEPMTMTEEPFTSTAEECQRAIRALPLEES